MTVRILLILPVVAGTIGGSPAIAQLSAPLPPMLRSSSGESTWVEVSSQSPTPAVSRQPAYLSQPEYLDGSTPFAGPVPVEELVQYALANNPAIQATRYRAQSLGARVPQAASLPDPQLAATAFLEEIQTAAGPQEVALSLSQKFPWFGKRALRSQVAYHGSMAAYSQVAAEELKVVEQVKHAYYDLYLMQNAALETGRLQPRLEDVIRIARTKYETNVGGVGLGSVLQVQVELSKLKTTLIQLEQAKVEARARLAGALHLPPQTPFETQSEVDGTNVAHTADILMGLADSSQPEFDSLRREVSRDSSSIDLARREYWPDVTLGFNWYEMGSSGISPVANGRDAFSFGVGVNLPIYQKRLDAAVREAQCRTAASRSRYAARVDQIRSEIQALYAQFQQHHQVLTILESEILPLADRTLELTMESYRTGAQDFQQLIDSYRTLLDFRIDYHKRVALREKAIASLERAVGCAVTSGAAN